MTTKEETLKFIIDAHRGQKYGSLPYWRHPLEVANVGKKVFGGKFTEDCYITALLHDVIEDTKYTLNDLLKMGYSRQILDSVDLLTKIKTLSYEDNIKRIMNSGNRIAMMVKYSDNLVNFTGDKSSWPKEKRIKSNTKYAWSLNTLGNRLGVKSDFSYVEE